MSTATTALVIFMFVIAALAVMLAFRGHELRAQALRAVRENMREIEDLVMAAREREARLAGLRHELDAARVGLEQVRSSAVIEADALRAAATAERRHAEARHDALLAELLSLAGHRAVMLPAVQLGPDRLTYGEDEEIRADVGLPPLDYSQTVASQHEAAQRIAELAAAEGIELREAP